MDRVEAAVTEFEKGLNCSQAILTGFPEYGLDQDVALRLATALGGGMARTGQICGAVSGALMVIGLKYGSADSKDTETKERTYQLARRFMDEFCARNNNVNCSALLGVDIGDPDAYAYAREHELFKKFCPAYVRSAAEILEKILTE